MSAMVLRSWKCSLCLLLLQRTLDVVLMNFTNVLFAYALVPVKIQPFSFPQAPEEGKTIQVTCGVEEGDDPVKFTWLKNGNIVHSADHLTILTHKRLSVLIVNNVNVNDIGNYSCLATNPGGEDKFSSELLVRGPPRWNQEPQDVIVGVGDKAVINCTALGHPKPVVRWARETSRGVADVGLTALPRSDRVREDKNGALVIDSAQPEDAGYYNCRASTGIGTDLVKTVQVTVRGEATVFVNKTPVRSLVCKNSCPDKEKPTLNLFFKYCYLCVYITMYIHTASKQHTRVHSTLHDYRTNSIRVFIFPRVVYYVWYAKQKAVVFFIRYYLVLTLQCLIITADQT
ncbi:Down syndrome cell adhesion molecule-like protein 1 isoform X1 [Limulus polyphemus]|uniref:Down syndrome cell adhesion molecule-like protein 1 isoform X1 n=1 Tax=Limulus polyphemus TaxID=6850 RepID=A0ABM1TMJ3_LIMPO|nr:Down syndrome cell adhesion molecule-like protein 1 isoform X1 [Limulus polyphemus]